MDYMRNPEVRREIKLYAVILAVTSAVGFVFTGVSGGIALVCAGLIYCALHFASSRRRYKRIRELCRDIDHIVHGDDSVELDGYSEGELSILQGEVQKMTLRLRSSADELRRDKLFLTDSIADISHQLRTPLTSINLILAMLSDPELEPARRAELTMELK